MTPDEFKRRFPNASAATIAANCPAHPELFEPEVSPGGKAPDNAPLRPKLERRARNAALGPREEKGADSASFLVRVTSVRRRLIDEDNLCEKYVVDCCRNAGLLHGDSPAETHIQVAQRKAGKEEEEHTLIEIFDIRTPAKHAGFGIIKLSESRKSVCAIK